MLSEPSGDLGLRRNIAAITILDNDGPRNEPYLSIENDSSGESGPAQVKFSLSEASHSEPITVEIRTVDTTAVAGQDYVAVTEVVTFPPGRDSYYFEPQIVNDAGPERVESFLIIASNPSPGLRLRDPMGIVRSSTTILR